VEVRLAEPLVVVVAFELLGSAVLVEVITLPKGSVALNPTATCAETPIEFSQAPEAAGAATPATKLSAAHCAH